MTKQAQTRKRRRRRRGPVGRFLLLAGPFFFLTAAIALSAGIVEVIEQPPGSQPVPTLAEERARAAGPTAEPVPPFIAARRMPSLDALPDSSEYDLESSLRASLPVDVVGDFSDPFPLSGTLRPLYGAHSFRLAPVNPLHLDLE